MNRGPWVLVMKWPSQLLSNFSSCKDYFQGNLCNCLSCFIFTPVFIIRSYTRAERVYIISTVIDPFTDVGGWWVIRPRTRFNSEIAHNLEPRKARKWQFAVLRTSTDQKNEARSTREQHDYFQEPITKERPSFLLGLYDGVSSFCAKNRQTRYEFRGSKSAPTFSSQ